MTAQRSHKRDATPGVRRRKSGGAAVSVGRRRSPNGSAGVRNCTSSPDMPQQCRHQRRVSSSASSPSSPDTAHAQCAPSASASRPT